MPAQSAPSAFLQRLASAAMLGCVLLALLSACAALSPPTPLEFREIQREDDVYRVIGRWQGDVPADLEHQMLVRCAQVARREGGAAFFVVNADIEVTSPEFLRQGSAVTPVFRVPEESAKGGRTATLTIKIFPKGKEPEGYRLYDVENLLRPGRPVTLRFGVTTGTGVGFQA